MTTTAGWRPSGRVEVVAGTPPGGGQDRAARALADALRDRLDHPVLVSNKPGLGGANAWAYLSDRPGDGHVLAISSPTLITNPLTGVAAVGPQAVTQVALLCTEYIAFAVAADGLLTSAAALLTALATPQPPAVALATARGNVNHIALALLCRHVGADPRAVPVRVHDSAVLAIDDCLAGEADVVAVSAASIVPRVGDGSLLPLAVSAPRRLEAPLEQVPTWEEDDVACTVGTWRGVVAPPRISTDVVGYWTQAIGTAVRGESWHRARRDHLWAETFLAVPAVGRFIAAEEATMRTALTALGLLAE